MSHESLGAVELSSAAAGLAAADCMLKSASVRLSFCEVVCSGKFALVCTGSSAAVNAAVENAAQQSGVFLCSRLVLSSVHPSIPRCLAGGGPAGGPGASVDEEPEAPESWYAFESTSIGLVLRLCDGVLKSVRCSLEELVLPRGTGGKAAFVVGGRQQDVEAAAALVEDALEDGEEYWRAGTSRASMLRRCGRLPVPGWVCAGS